MGITYQKGQWAEHERVYINILEPKAVFFGIGTYCHIRSFKSY